MRLRFPILDIPPSEGDQALLGYKLDEEGSRLFRERVRATCEVADADDLTALHSAAQRVGMKYGLAGTQSVAFWRRTTFRLIEPPCRCPMCSPDSASGDGRS